MKSPGVWLVIIITAALVLRLGAAVALGNSAERVSGAWDQQSYDLLAQRVLEGHGFSFATSWYPFTSPNEQTAHWSFLYTLYLAGVYSVFGHSPLAGRLIQVLISVAQIWLAYRLGRRLFGEWVGAAAAALTAGYAYFVFFNAALMTQTFYIICVLASMDIAITLAEPTKSETAASRPPLWTMEGKKKWGSGETAKSTRSNYRGEILWVLLGLTLGAGALLRQTLLLFAPVVVVGILESSGEKLWRPRRATIRGVAIAALAVAGFVLPWTARNYMVYHDLLLLNSNGGYWLYSSNHPNQGTDFNGSYVAPLPQDLKGLAEPAMDRALYQAGIRFILEDPKRFILLSISRIGDYFWVGPSERSATISNLGRILSFTIYWPFFLYGLFLSRKNWRLCLPLYLYAAFDTLLCLTTWSSPRYRLPTDAVLMPFAGLAVVNLATRLPFLFRRRTSPAVPSLD